MRMEEKDMPKVEAISAMGALPPPFTMPVNSREVVITHAQAFNVSMRLILPSCIRIFVLLFLLHTLIAIYYNGFQALSYPLELLTTFFLPAGIFVLFSALVAFAAHRKVQTYKMYGIPILYGFDEAALYAASPYGLESIRWESAVTWKEVGAFFLLSDGVKQRMLPKTMWTEEELEHLRAIMREKVGKPLPPDAPRFFFLPS